MLNEVAPENEAPVDTPKVAEKQKSNMKVPTVPRPTVQRALSI